MRQKFVLVTAIAICLSLALVPALASGRTADRYGDRTKAAKGQGPTAGVVPTFSDSETRRMPIGSRLSSNNSVANKAAALLSAATKQEGEVAIATLQRVTTFDLESTEQNDRVLAGAYEMLADLNAGHPTRQVVYLGFALQYASTPAQRTSLESQITSLGGDLFSVAFGKDDSNSYVRRDPGADDTCDGGPAVALPHFEIMSITVNGDHNWRSFDVPGLGGTTSSGVRVETISSTVLAGFPPDGSDDTTLTLWDGCNLPAGEFVAFSQDKTIPHTDFTSRIVVDCVYPGTYHVDVGGFADARTPDDFALEIELLEACIVPAVDGFGVDNDRYDDLADIGLPTANSGNGWGRSKKEIQSRSIAPRLDVDHAQFGLSQNSLVRMGTKETWPTFWNGFTDSGTDNPDTVMTLLYENEPDYGGRCNQQATGFFPTCYSAADCPDPLNQPVPGLPACIPLSLFFDSIFPEIPLAVNDDRALGDLGSELLMCLPRTQPGTGSLTLDNAIGDMGTGGEWVLRVNGWSRFDVFNYELNVKNEVGCLFEQEPNDPIGSDPDSLASGDATPYELGTTVAGFFDYVVTNPYQDWDLYQFDVDEETEVVFSTNAPDANQSDTALEMIVGPDDNGDFFFCCGADEDGGSGFLSVLELTLLPASEELGNVTADADYYLNVTSNYFNPNYYYELTSEIVTGPEPTEVEPNNTYGTANTIVLGEHVFAAIDSGCDYDTFAFTLTGDTFVTIESTSGGDSAMELVDASDESLLTCDDDSAGGFRPLIDGCLPAGDYLVQVRAFSAGDAFDYELQLDGTGGCTPTVPPTMSGDNAYTCLDFDTCP